MAQVTPRVAVIGAGIAGLSAAAKLSERCVVELFDMGGRGVGGRASSSRPAGETTPPLTFDHGCQLLTATDASFRARCATLERAGAIARWDARFGVLRARDGAFIAKADLPTSSSSDDRPLDFFGVLSSEDVFVGTPTMVGASDGLLSACSIARTTQRQRVCVTSLTRSAKTRSWRVMGVDVGRKRVDAKEAAAKMGERDLGSFDAVVVTDVMCATSGTQGSCALTLEGEDGDGDGSDSDGSDSVAAACWREMSALPPQSLFSLMIAFPTPLTGPQFDAAVVEDSDVVHFLSRDSSKPGRGRDDGVECWTAVSTEAFAREMVARAPLSVDGKYNPQTAEYLAQITPTMRDEVLRLLRGSCGGGTHGVGAGSVPAPVHVASQRWGNAFPSTPIASGGGGSGPWFAHDATRAFAACGDFVGGAGVERAWLSGTRAGEAVSEALLARGGRRASL